MVEYTGRYVGVAEARLPFEQLYAAQELNRQTEWQNRLLRDDTDRARRAARDIGARDLQLMEQNRGLFDNRNGLLQNLHRQEHPGISPNTPPMEMFPEPAPDAGMGGVDEQGRTIHQPMQLDSRSPPGQESERWRRLRASATAPQPARIRDLTPEQLDAWVAYVHATRTNPVAQRVSPNLNANSRPRPGVTSEQQQAALAALRATGLDIQNNQLVVGSTATPTASVQALPWDESSDAAFQQALTPPEAPAAEAEAGAQQARGGVTPPTPPGAQAAAEDPLTNEWYQGTHDTSRPLEMTPEMEALDYTIQSNLNRAEVYAQYGMTDLSQQAVNMAIQGQAAYWQQENVTLLRALAGGNLSAGAALIARFNGYPEGTTRIRLTNERRPRHVLEVQDENDPSVWRSAYELPLDREALYNSLETVADAANARQRREITAENQRAIMEGQIRMYVADRELQGRVFASMTEAEIAQYNNIAERALQRPIMQTDGAGGIWWAWPETNEDGGVTWQLSQARVRDVPTANVDGEEETIQAPVGQRVTGLTNIPARGQ